MAVKQKPDPKIVKPAAKELGKKPQSTKPSVQAKTAARILDDQKNAPQPHKPKASPKKK
ncbi:MAG: hypothetical protein WBX25_07240 [Rhodomicrobium sp.]